MSARKFSVTQSGVTRKFRVEWGGVVSLNGVIISDVELENPKDGQGWLESTTGIVYYWDATQEVWVALPPTGESEPQEPAAHASTHATGGDDELTPGDIGAMANTNDAVNAAIATDPAATRAAAGAATSFHLIVKDAPFNAVGDGVADDTAAIQAALDSAGPARSVYVPAGIYKLTDTLVFKRAGTTLYGDGQYSTEIVQSDPTKHGIAWVGYDGIGIGSDSTQQCDIRHLALTGPGGDASTGSAIFARKEGTDNFLTAISTFESLRITGFKEGVFATNWAKLVVRDCRFLNCQYSLRLRKADTFIVENCAMGAASVTSETVGILMEKAAGVTIGGNGGNFGGIVTIGEFGDLDRFIQMDAGSLTVIEPNLERVGIGEGQCVVYLQGRTQFRWVGGRIENGPGVSPQAYIRVKCVGSGEDAGVIPTVSIDGMNLGAGGWRAVEFFGDLNYLGTVISNTGSLPIVYTATEAGAALISTSSGTIARYGSSTIFNLGAGSRGNSYFVPIADASAGNDALLVVARNKANAYARRDLINDNLTKILYSSAALLSSAAGAETTLLAYNVPAYAAAEIGWEIRIRVVGRFANNTNSKRIRLSLDNPSFYQFYDSGSAAYQNSAFVIEGTYHVRAASQNAMTAVCISDDVLVMPKITAPENYSPSFDAAKDFKILTTGVAAGDVKIHSVRIVAVKGSAEF
jgi:hypothetical protein